MKSCAKKKKKKDIVLDAYKKALDEDAVMDECDAAVGGGDVMPADAPSADNSIQDPGISRDEVLGKYVSGKGVLGKDDFNIPVNALGKGNILKRIGYPSKKRKGHKNPYIKGMTVIGEEDVLPRTQRQR